MSTLEGAYHSSKYATIKKMEVFKLGKKFKITMDMAMHLENYEYNEMIRLAAVLNLARRWSNARSTRTLGIQERRGVVLKNSIIRR